MPTVKLSQSPKSSETSGMETRGQGQGGGSKMNGLYTQTKGLMNKFNMLLK